MVNLLFGIATACDGLVFPLRGVSPACGVIHRSNSFLLPGGGFFFLPSRCSVIHKSNLSLTLLSPRLAAEILGILEISLSSFFFFS